MSRLQHRDWSHLATPEFAQAMRDRRINSPQGRAKQRQFDRALMSARAVGCGVTLGADGTPTGTGSGQGDARR